jgi:hypothetical protein
VLQRTLVGNGTKHHFAATQQTVALGVIADIGSEREIDANDISSGCFAAPHNVAPERP